MKPRLTLYTRAGCHLCDHAWDMLNALAGEMDFTLSKVDITSDPALFARFRYLIPVVDVEHGPALYGVITTDSILTAIAARSPQPHE